MKGIARLLVPLLFVVGGAGVGAQDNGRAAPRKLPDGVYAVRRDGLKEKEVLPLKAGEVLVVHRPRYLKKEQSEPTRFLVVASAADVSLDLVAPPRAVKEEDKGVRILLKLRPKAATSLHHLTRDHCGGQVAIILGGEVVTTHKVRDVIASGELQITSCVPGSAEYLLKQLQAHYAPNE